MEFSAEYGTHKNNHHVLLLNRLEATTSSSRGLDATRVEAIQHLKAESLWVENVSVETESFVSGNGRIICRSFSTLQ